MRVIVSSGSDMGLLTGANRLGDRRRRAPPRILWGRASGGRLTIARTPPEEDVQRVRAHAAYCARQVKHDLGAGGRMLARSIDGCLGQAATSGPVEPHRTG
jgi:hypothetical protein